MTNAEIVKGIKCCMLIDYNCDECPYHQYGKTCNTMLYIDVMKFLPPIFNKEQEPILLENQHKPYGISTNANSPWISRCPRCSKKVEGKQTRFCKYCGQAVKWE